MVLPAAPRAPFVPLRSPAFRRQAVAVTILVCLSLLGTCDAFAGISILPVARPGVRGSCVSRMAEERFYDRAGGAGVVDTCVEDFYDRLEDDDELLKGMVLRKTGKVDIEYLKDNQWNMMRFAFKGKPLNGPLRLADLATSLDSRHWDKLMAYMDETFQFLGLEQSIADEAKANALLLKEKFEKNKELNEKFNSK